MAGNPRIDELRKKLDKEPGSRLFAQLAEELRKDGDLEDAIRVAREGLQKHSNYPSARMTLGRALFDTGDWSAARAEFELVLKGAPDNILASRLLAESLESLGDVPAAIARYKKTLALAPRDKQVLARLDALEKPGAPLGAAPGAAVPAAAPAAAAPPPAAPRAPIPIVAVDTPMELEQPHERATAFAPGPAAPSPPAAPRPPSSESAASVAPPPAASEPAPIPLVAADEDFELERPYEPPQPSVAAAPRPPAAQAGGPSATPPAPHPPAESSMEFEFDAGPSGPTIPFAPAPAPAPAESAPPAPAPAPPPSAPATVAVPPLEAPPPPPAVAAPDVPAAFESRPHAPAPPAAANTVEVPWAAPVPPPSAAAPVPAFAPEPEPPPAPAQPAAAAPAAAPPPPPPAAAPPAPSPAPEAASGELMSATLAELYFKQGFAEKAVEVYRRLIEREPENDRLRRRLAELQDTRPAPAPASDTGTDQASRRVALQRTIAKLEGMLAAIRKG